MKAIRIHEHGGPEVMRFEDIDTPAPSGNQVLVRIEASGVNFIDIQFRTGGYRPASLPFTLGMEGAGTVEAVGDDVTSLAAGDRVAYAMIPGSYAEYALVAEDRLVKIPDGLDVQSAAAAMLQGMTAHYLVHSTYPLKAGETVLLHAAAGGAGALIAQMARNIGARVIGTVGSEAKVDVARAAGVSDVIIYTKQDFEAEVKRLTDGRGVDVVIDSVGKDTFDHSLNCLRPRGYLVLFGFSSGAVPPFDPAELGARGSLFLTRPGLNKYIETREELVERASAVFAWLQSGDLVLRIEDTLPLGDAAEAHTLLESRKTTGKLLLKP
jgi:NADPH2:quinone reductase